MKKGTALLQILGLAALGVLALAAVSTALRKAEPKVSLFAFNEIRKCWDLRATPLATDGVSLMALWRTAEGCITGRVLPLFLRCSAGGRAKEANGIIQEH